MTHPALDLVWVTAAPGEIGLMRAPGHGDGVAQDLAAVKAQNVAVLVSLIEASEPHLLDIAGCAAGTELGWHHLPIADFAVPDAAWERAWQTVRPHLHHALDQGQRIAVHCRGGRGRSGLVAARLLIERGCDADAAISAVRAVRPEAIETPEQMAYVRAVLRRE
ncbi:MAG: phosphatase [Geminicoccaceae bacterium]|nr:MAG: phosphatase [Geminicoccaceae bacterium]